MIIDKKATPWEVLIDLDQKIITWKLRDSPSSSSFQESIRFVVAELSSVKKKTQTVKLLADWRCVDHVLPADNVWAGHWLFEQLLVNQAGAFAIVLPESQSGRSSAKEFLLGAPSFALRIKKFTNIEDATHWLVGIRYQRRSH